MASERSSGSTERHEYPRPGNYYIMKGTWVLRPRSSRRDQGVVASIESHGPESPRDREGSINILWFPDASEHLPARSFFKQLRTGRLIVDDRQHPYDKTEWGYRSADAETEQGGQGDA